MFYNSLAVLFLFHPLHDKITSSLVSRDMKNEQQRNKKRMDVNAFLNSREADDTYGCECVFKQQTHTISL